MMHHASYTGPWPLQSALLAAAAVADVCGSIAVPPPLPRGMQRHTLPLLLPGATCNDVTAWWWCGTGAILHLAAPKAGPEGASRQAHVGCMCT